MLDALGNVGEFVSSIAVVISLFYLALQTKRNTEAERASTYQAVVFDFGSLNETMASTPGLAALFINAMEDFDNLSPEERARVSQLFFRVFHNFESMFYQHKQGYLEHELWLGWMRLMQTYFARPGFQSWWRLRREVFSQSFAEFLETQSVDKDLVSYYDLANASTLSAK